MEYIWQALNLQERRLCRGIENIRHLLEQIIPSKVREAGIPDMPLSGDWVGDISEDDFKLMDSALGWGNQAKSWWVEIYWNLNLVFGSTRRASDAQAILKKMEELVRKGVPPVPLLLIPGAAYLLCYEPIKRQWAGIESKDAKDLKANLETLAEEKQSIQNALQVLMGLAGLDSGSSLLDVGDITDWPKFLLKLSSDGNADKPTPGKRIWRLLPEIHSIIEKIMDSSGHHEEQKSNIIDALNDKILDSQKFYQKKFFSSTPIPEEAKGLLANRATLSSIEAIRLNRLLIEAAYPHEIAKGPDVFAYSALRERVSHRLREENFNIELVGKLKRVEAILAEEEKEVRQDFCEGRFLLDGFKLPIITSKHPYAYNAFGGLADLIEKYDEWARQSAGELFNLWGMGDINDASERQYKSRARKKGNKAKRRKKSGRHKKKL